MPTIDDDLDALLNEGPLITTPEPEPEPVHLFFLTEDRRRFHFYATRRGKNYELLVGSVYRAGEKPRFSIRNHGPVVIEPGSTPFPYCYGWREHAFNACLRYHREVVEHA